MHVLTQRLCFVVDESEAAPGVAPAERDLAVGASEAAAEPAKPEPEPAAAAGDQQVRHHEQFETEHFSEPESAGGGASSRTGRVKQHGLQKTQVPPPRDLCYECNKQCYAKQKSEFSQD